MKIPADRPNRIGPSAGSSHARPPVGGAFVGFTGAGSIGLVLVALESDSSLDITSSASTQIGVVAATVFAISGLLAAYRAIMTRAHIPAIIAVVLLGPAAGWTWASLVSKAPLGNLASQLVVLSLVALAITMLGRGLRSARWLEVFSGLGSLILAGAATAVRSDPALAETNISLSILAAIAGMTCLYGLLVDLEVSEHRSLEELLQSKEHTEAEIQRTEDLLHDLRSGLLSIEAAIGGFDSDMADPVRSEAARLRKLTLNGTRNLTTFDLVPKARDLVNAKRAGGTIIDIRTPTRVSVTGEESEIMSIVENLVSNAERHGEAPITIEIAEGRDTVTVAVADSGRPPGQHAMSSIFKRGFTTHPDGEGVGLSRARLLAELNNAALEMSPDEQGNTRFILTMSTATHAAASP